MIRFEGPDDGSGFVACTPAPPCMQQLAGVQLAAGCRLDAGWGRPVAVSASQPHPWHVSVHFIFILLFSIDHCLSPQTPRAAPPSCATSWA